MTEKLRRGRGPKAPPGEEKDENFGDLFFDFCNATSLHGWYFFGSTKLPEGGRPSGDQMFWLLIIVLSMSAAVFVMGTNIQEFRDATVAYNLESPTVPLDEVFFPSMVVCNMNTLRRSFITSILEDSSIKGLNVSYNELKQILFSVFILGGDYQPTERDTLIIDNMVTSDTYMSLFRELVLTQNDSGPFNRSYSTVPIYKLHQIQLTENLTENMAKYSRGYVPELAVQFREEEMILRMKLNGAAIQYSGGFTTDISESCVWLTPFIKEPGDLEDLWTMVPFAKNSLPNGLELLIDAESYDYAISSTGSEGIVMSILYQLDIPIMKNIGINLQPGKAVTIAVTPTLITTNAGARRRFQPVRRQCYFEDEIQLLHFPPQEGYRYEMSNCLFEATLQKIEEECNCTPKYFVDIVDGFEACEGKLKQCMNLFMAEMGDQRDVLDRGELKPCLAACVDQQYKFLVTHATYPNEDAFEGTANFCFLAKKMLWSCRIEKRRSLDLKYPKLCPLVISAEDLIDNIDCAGLDEGGAATNDTNNRGDESSLWNPDLTRELFLYARKNLIKANIYIKDPYVSKYVTEEKITEISFVGGVGGILGLFLGFSFVSAVEVFYVFCCKLSVMKVKSLLNSRNRKVSDRRLVTVKSIQRY